MANKFSFDAEVVQKLAEILVKTDLTEIEVEDNGARIFVSRRASAPTMVESYSQIHSPSPLNLKVHPSADIAPLPTPATLHIGAVKSPMVGTAYLSPEPGAPHFIKVGDDVKEGQTLLIIEAMKVMNPIKAPKNGKVIQILAKDTFPVEFDEPLVIIE